MPSLRVFVPVLLLASVTGQAAEKPFGLEKRVPWNDSRVVGSPDPPPPYKTTRAFPKLTVKQPLSLTPEPGTNRLFMLRHDNVWAGPGHLAAIDDNQNASHVEDLLKIDGLAYGVAFHPNYEHNGYIYIGLSGPLNGRKATQVRRYTVDRRPPHHFDPKSKLIIIDWASNGHDGGDVTFGNDGFLYVSSGDGSSGSDAHMTGQRIDDLLAAVFALTSITRAMARTMEYRRTIRSSIARGPAPSCGPMACVTPGGFRTTASRGSSGSAKTGKTCGSRST